jgi:hypothetical protein
MTNEEKLAKHFEEIAICLKPLLREAKGEVGVFLIERKDACAAIIAADSGCDQAHLIRALRLFQKRLGEMINHTELDMSSNTIIRDSETGDYREPREDDAPGLYN